MSEQEAIAILKDGLKMKEEISHLVPVYELAIEALEKQSMVNEILNEAEQYKLALFAVIRSNSMETAMEQGLSMTMHSMLTVKIIQQVIEKCNFGALKVLYDEALAKMGGK